MNRLLPLMPVFTLACCQGLPPQPEAPPSHPASAKAQAAPWSPPPALASAPSLAGEAPAPPKEAASPAPAGGAHSHHGEGGGK